MSNSKESKPRNLSEAISRLEHVAGDKAEQLRGVLGRDYEEFKQAFDDLKPYMSDVRQSAEQELRERCEPVQQMARKVDDEVHRNPWWSLGLVALLALVFGFIMGRRK